MGQQEVPQRLDRRQLETLSAGDHVEKSAARNFTPSELLGQLARELQGSARVALKDQFGTPVLSDGPNSWSGDNEQYWQDLRASISLDPAGNVLLKDLSAIRDEWPKIIGIVSVIAFSARTARRGKGAPAIVGAGVVLGAEAFAWLQLPVVAKHKLDAWLAQVEIAHGRPEAIEVAKERFVEFVVAAAPVILMVVGRLRWAASRVKGSSRDNLPMARNQSTKRDVPTLQIPGVAPRGAIPFLGMPSMLAVEGGYLGEVGFSGNIDVVPPPRGVLLPTVQSSASERVPSAENQAAKRMLEAQKMPPAMLERLLGTEGVLERLSSSNPAVRDYAQQIVRAHVDGALRVEALKHLIDQAESLLGLPEATRLRPFNRGGETSRHYLAEVNNGGEVLQVFLKLPADPFSVLGVANDLRTAKDLGPRGGVAWSFPVRARHKTLGWVEGAAMEPFEDGFSYSLLYEQMIAGQSPSVEITIDHVRALRKIQVDAAADGVLLDDEHPGQYIARPRRTPARNTNGDRERLVVPVDMMVLPNTPYLPRPGLRDPMNKARQLAEYQWSQADKKGGAEAAVEEFVSRHVKAAEAQLKQWFSKYDPKNKAERQRLVRRVSDVLTDLGVDESLIGYLPKLDDFQLRTLVQANGFLEGVTASNERLRLHTEDLAWEYALNRMPLEVLELYLSKATSVLALPAILGLSDKLTYSQTYDACVYWGTLNGRMVGVMVPRLPQEDYRVDEFLQSMRLGRNPVPVRILDFGTRVWRRGVAWEDQG